MSRAMRRGSSQAARRRTAASTAATLALAALPSVVDARPIAVGAAPSAYRMSDEQWGLAVELFGHSYLKVDKRWFLRPGLRLGYRGLTEPEQARGLAINERDISSLAELAIVRDGSFVPSLTVMAGVVARSLSLQADAVDTMQSKIPRWEALPTVSAQVGVGLPLWRGRLVLEPFARLELTVGDSRQHLRLGVETSFAM